MGIIEREKEILRKISSLIFGKDVKEGKQIYKETMGIAWPSMVESFLVNLTGFLDTIMVSALGVPAVAAVGLTNQPKFVAIAIFLALCASISSIVARRMGENDKESANRILKMSLLFSTILIVFVSFICVVYADWIIKMCGSQPDTHDMAVEYFQIVMYGMIFTTTSLIINAAQRGAGKTRISMVTNISSNVVNVIFNYLLIGGNFGFPEMGVVGAAYATVIGSVVACALSTISIFKKDGFIYIKAVKGWIARAQDIKSILNVGTSSFVEQIFTRIGFLSISIIMANLGTVAFGANQIGSNFITLSLAFAEGLSIAAIALVGRSLGKKEYEKAQKYSSACTKIGFLCSFIISMIFIFFGGPLFQIFSTDPEVLDYGTMITTTLSIAIFGQMYQSTTSSALRGAGDTKYTAFVSLISIAVVRPVTSWILCYPMGLGLTGAWISLCIDQSVRCIMCYTRYKKGNWVNIKL